MNSCEKELLSELFMYFILRFCLWTIILNMNLNLSVETSSISYYRGKNFQENEMCGPYVP